MKKKLFAHSRLDGLLVLLAFVQFGLLVYGVLSCGSVTWGQSLGVGLLSAFLIATNYMCIGHNFVHNPFFTSRRLNMAFSAFNSLLVGAPVTLHRIHHMQHHKYNNDAPDPETGTTKDYTSTWRYGRPPGQEEGFLRYALLAHFRSDFSYLLREVKRLKRWGRLALESAALLAMLAVIALLNPLGLIAFYFPLLLLGNIATHAQNYLEHHGATPGDRTTDSVSCYGRLYNLVWFNNGYHQEHHFRPQVHWSRLPQLTPLLPPATERCVVRWAHWFNFGEPVGPASRRSKHHQPTEAVTPN
jgi:fatty acid desaturase